jgi:hypothetical protein
MSAGDMLAERICHGDIEKAGVSGLLYVAMAKRCGWLIGVGYVAMANAGGLGTGTPTRRVR